MRFGVGREKRAEIFAGLGLGSLKPKLPPDRQLWIMAEDDAYIAAHLVKRQWAEWGKPPITWLPGGHMTFPLHISKIVESTRDFHEELVRRR